MNKFKLGTVCMTHSINNDVADNEQFAKDVTNALGRYMRCDWGNMCQEDKDANTAAVESGEDRILAAYETSKGKIWIITEWNRSATTILYPDEY